MTQPKHLAYPGLVPGPYQGLGWNLLQCDPWDAKTSPATQDLHVPRAITQEDAMVRLHELAHIERAEDVPAGMGNRGEPIRDMLRMMVEEVAVETMKYRQGLSIYRCRDHFDWTGFPYPRTRHDLAGMWLQLAGSVPHTRNQLLREYFESVYKLLGDTDTQILRKALGDLQRDFSHQNCEKWATILAGHFSPPVQTPETPKKKNKEQEEEEDEQEEIDAEREEQEKESEGDRDNSRLENQTVSTERGTVDIHRHTANRLAVRQAAPRWLATDAIGSLRYPRNLYRGGRIFGRRARGGSIVVDVSQSMDWNKKQLEDASRNLPNLWIGAYDAPRGSRAKARLCIVASNGRIGSLDVLDEPEHSHYNKDSGADDAVLQWVSAHAPGPVVWVSDGIVGEMEIAPVEKTMARTRIPRVLTIEDAILYLQGRSVPGWHGVPHVNAAHTEWTHVAPTYIHRP